MPHPYGERLMAALRDFWAVGIERVSPGALGMRVRHEPFERHEIEAWILNTPGIRYEPGMGPRWDHGWIVQE